MSPNRLNLRFSVQKLKKEQQLKKLNGLVDLVKKEGIITPKTIVFCNAMDEIAVVVNHLMSQLGKKVFFPNCSPVKDNCLIGIYHSNSWQSSKDRVMEQFKSCGVKRVIIATTALCMGVNFPDVWFIINWGPARSSLDQHQEAGRAGRDGKRAHVVVINFIMGNKLDIAQVKVRRDPGRIPLIPPGIPGGISGIPPLMAGSRHSHLGLKINPTWDPA